MLNGYTAVLFSAVILSAAVFMGVSGIGSDRIPDDVSVRVESANSGTRTHRRGGIHHGK